MSPRKNIYDDSNDSDDKIQGFLDSDQEIDETKTSTFFSKWMGKVKNIVGDKVITP